MVSFYVYESFGTLGKVKDYLVGKVAFKRSQLPADGPDQWWPLQPVDDDLEILGQIHLHTSVSETEPGVFSAAVRFVCAEQPLWSLRQPPSPLTSPLLCATQAS